MTDQSQISSERGDIWQRGFAVAGILLLLAAYGSAHAGDSSADSIWTETYAGLFAGSGLAQNRLVDVDGFANWGYPGSLSEYDDQGFAWGALAGSRFELAGTPLRFEVDATFGGLSASTDRLDPKGRDETAIADYQWLATARAGVENRLGGVTLFATGGWRRRASTTPSPTSTSFPACRRAWTPTIPFGTAPRILGGPSEWGSRPPCPIPGPFASRAPTSTSEKAPTT